MMNKDRKNIFGEELGELLEAWNISINDYAERIDTTPKNLIDIINGNVALSQNMIYNIAFISEIPVNYIETTEMNFALDKKIDCYLKKNNIKINEYAKKFNYKELESKYNIVYNDERSYYSILQSIFKYLRISDPETLYKPDSIIFYKSKNDKPELLALWLERCYRVVSKQNIGVYNKNNINILVNYIKKCAKNNIFNKEELIKTFNENGVFLAIEDDLNGSKIRGAFKVLKDKPAIYITKKHKRYADIYFALLHELAHLKSDFNRAKKASIISLMDELETEEYEIRADKQAYKWMVDDKLYNTLKSDINSINNDNIIKSFLVYRMAKDKIITYNSKMYQTNNLIIKEL